MSTPPGNRDLLERQIRNLFIFDDDGRLVRTNEPDSRPAPLFYLARSADGCVGFVGDGVPATIAAKLLAAVEAEQPTDEFSRPARALDIAAAVALAMGVAGSMRRGPAYVARADPPPFEIDAEVAPAAGQRLHPWIAERWHTTTLPPLELAFGVIVRGEVVAVCHSARCGPGDVEAGVETAEDFRRRGYAAAATAAWVRAARASGRMAFYSTDWENAASQGVARRLGLELLGELSQVIG